jgi:ATP-binding protein involved in chromosome partitioning
LDVGMTNLTEQSILDALKGVLDPDKKKDIVTLGMISGMVIRDGNVAFSIEVEAERGPRLEPLRRAAEEAVAALPNVLSATAVLTAQRTGQRTGATPPPPQSTAGQGGGARGSAGPGSTAGSRPPLPGIRTIIAVASGKGGVGKSTTAVNLALAFHANGLRTGILDADIYGPSIPRMLAITGHPISLDGKTMTPLENFGIKTMSIGYLVEEDTAMIWRGPMVMSAIQQMLSDVLWGELDILIVDLPPGTGDAQLTLAQKVPLNGAVMVTTPQDIALLDVRRGINMFNQVKVPILGLVENMSYFLCPQCNHRTDIFSHGGARIEAERYQVEFLGEIPIDIAIRESSDGGHPIVISQPDGPHATAYRSIARRLWEKLSGEADEAAREAPRIVIQ